MNVDAFTKGIKRATDQRKQQQAKAVNIPTKSATQQQTAKPVAQQQLKFNLEAYRLDIISKAITYIIKQKGAYNDRQD
ncbi:hypothetical protein D3C76_338490 [compost metagenome]|uniref:Uncharacterized protein n=1 Tax=Pseudomonas putida TaxID=303 RepID=A0A7D5VZ07_PSEPU|nr:hypothetical protein [Pseudomonas putida]QLJ15089.1 hypothetical protein H0H12_03840 [Pseudomonas putida]